MDNNNMENEITNNSLNDESNANAAAISDNEVAPSADIDENFDEEAAANSNEEAAENSAADLVEADKDRDVKKKKVKKGKKPLRLSKKAITIGSIIIAVVLIAVILTVTLVLTLGKKPNEQAKPKYTVTFETSGGSEIAPYELYEGDKIERPEDPTKAMFKFVNWYRDDKRTSVFDFDLKMPANDITIYAGWAAENSVLITFDANGGCFANGVKTRETVINVGAAIAKIEEEPAFTGYLFGGWSLKKSGAEAYNFGEKSTDNLTLYAIWNEDSQYAYVSYYGNGELVLKSPIKKGETLKKAAYNVENLVFDGWYKGAEKSEKYVFGAEITENLNLYSTFYTPELQMENGVVKGYYGTSRHIVIPDEYNGVKITEIGEYAFDGTSEYFEIKSVKLPATVTKIGEGAFYNCNALENVNLSDNVTTIGASAFSGCAKMQAYGDISKVTEIGERAFLGCENIHSAVFGEGLTTIGKMAFADCKGLTEIEIPEKVLNVPDLLFAGCTSLKRVEFKADGMATMTFGKEIFTGSGAETVIIRSKSRANFSAVKSEYLFSPFTGCKGLTIFVDSATINAYRNYYGNLDNDSFKEMLAEIA